MPKPIVNIALVVHPTHLAAKALAKKLVSTPPTSGLSFTCVDLPTIPAGLVKQSKSKKGKDNTVNMPSQNFDLAMVLGGDGTMMHACRHLGAMGIPLLGVNHGRLGFLTDLSDTTLASHLTDIREGRYTLERRYMLSATLLSVHTKKPIITSPLLAINDVYLSKSAELSVLEVNIFVDDEFVHCLRADGLIIAMPTGSTAYALSAGGPIMHPQAQGILLASVAPHMLTNRPIVLPASATITLKMAQGKSATLSADGQSHQPIDENTIIQIRRSTKSFQLAHPKGYSYYCNLREKLFWNELPTKR